MATLNYLLSDKQHVAYTSPATEILYGGAAGGAKSHLMRVALILWCAAIPGLQCYIFRRVMDDLLKNHMDGPHGFRNMLEGWVKVGLCTIVEDEIRFWNGSRIKLCHCKDEKHKYNYHGAEIHVLVIDELTTFTETIYRYLRFRVRMVGITIPDEFPELKGLFPRILCGTNPGNVGHLWVKQAFIDCGHAHGEVWRTPATEGGMLRQYLPAKLTDNPFLLRDDPLYIQRIEGLGSPQLVEAMLEGNWNVIAGAFFHEFDYDKHVLKPFPIPIKATRFRAIDWGSARPFSVGWYAIADSDWPTVENMGGEEVKLPRGALVRYREWYGMAKDQVNIGLKKTAEWLAEGICDRSRGETYAYTVLDPSAFAESGGPSIAERMRRAPKGKNVICRPADNERVVGWDQVRGRLKPDDEDVPFVYFVSNNHHLIRTLPALQHDEENLEDTNTDQEDHAPDELRYGCMSRPRTLRFKERPKPKSPYQFDVLTDNVAKPPSKYRG